MIICILDHISSSRLDMKFTFRISAAHGASIEVGVKSEEDLKQWVEAIRNGSTRSSVCMLTLTDMTWHNVNRHSELSATSWGRSICVVTRHGVRSWIVDITPVLRNVLYWLPVCRQILWWLSLPSTLSTALAQPTFNRSACRLLRSLVSHICALPNIVICWFLGWEISLADGVSRLQPQSSGTRFRHGCALPPLVVDNLEMGLQPTSSYKPKHDRLRAWVLSREWWLKQELRTIFIGSDQYLVMSEIRLELGY